jgi:hypothetical protein
MSLIYSNPNDYKTQVNTFITRMKSKNDYMEELSKQPATKSKKTPGDKLFDTDILKTNKNRMDLSHYTEILASSLLSEQEKKFYLLQQFMLKMADADYQEVSDIKKIFSKNAKHINELLSQKRDGKDNKLIFLVPNYEMQKSNFWLSLFFIELTRSILSPDYFINKTEQISTDTNSSDFTNEYNYIVVITDDISYSGEQISRNTFESTKIYHKYTLFFNLVGYSEVALARITYRKTQTNSTCNLVFARGAKYPLNKLSAKFTSNDLSNTNNVLYQKSLEDFKSINPKRGTRMLSSLLLNDVFYFRSDLKFISNLFNYYDYWETPRKSKDNNGSIQYLSIKYPDSFSTIENMCKFYKLQNVAILRIDRLIHYLILPGQTDEEKLDWLANKIIEKKLYEDNKVDIIIDSNLVNKFIEYSQDSQPNSDWPIHLNSFDKKFISIFKFGSGRVSQEFNDIVKIFNHQFSDTYYNNQLLNKFVNLNNKISKFNKKHMLEFVMPKSHYLLKNSSKYTIKNCGSVKGDIFYGEPYQSVTMYCNKNCELNFYREISWI